MVTRLANLGYRTAKRVVITLVGGTVVLVGVAMLVLPGPAMVVIPVGLAILGLEWAWARRFLRKIKETGAEALQRVGMTNAGGGKPGGGKPDPGGSDEEAA